MSAQEVNLGHLTTITGTLEGLVHQSFGPNALNSMLCTSTGKLLLTSSGTTILRAMHLDHPVARLVVDSLTGHHRLTGDSSKTFLFVVNSLVRQVERRGERMEMAMAFHTLRHQVLPLHIVPEIVRHCVVTNTESITVIRKISWDIIHTTLQGKLNVLAMKHITKLINEALFHQITSANEILPTIQQNIDDFELFCIENPGQPITASITLPGILIQRDFTVTTIRRPQPVRSVLVKCALEQETQTQVTFQVRDFVFIFVDDSRTKSTPNSELDW